MFERKLQNLDRDYYATIGAESQGIDPCQYVEPRDVELDDSDWSDSNSDEDDIDVDGNVPSEIVPEQLKVGKKLSQLRTFEWEEFSTNRYYSSQERHQPLSNEQKLNILHLMEDVKIKLPLWAISKSDLFPMMSVPPADSTVASPPLYIATFDEGSKKLRKKKHKRKCIPQISASTKQNGSNNRNFNEDEEEKFSTFFFFIFVVSKSTLFTSFCGNEN